MAVSDWFRPPRYLLALFLVLTLAPASGLVWLGWRMLALDRALARQQLQNRLEGAGDLIAAELDRELGALEGTLPALVTRGSEALERDGAVVVALGRNGLDRRAGSTLLFVPDAAPDADPSSTIWSAAEADEFQHGRYERAIAEFRLLAQSDDVRVRAGALVRMARNLRKADRTAEALQAYRDLAALGDVSVGGEPAALIGRQARCALLNDLGRLDESRAEAASLTTDLEGGRWPIDRSAFLFQWQQARRWTGVDDTTASLSSPRIANRLALATAIDGLYREWRDTARAPGGWHGRRSIWVNERPVLVIWRTVDDRLLGFAAAPRYIGDAWSHIWRDRRALVTLTDADGHRVFEGGPPGLGPSVVRTQPDTGLPWTLRVASAEPDQELAALAGRRALLLAGLGLTAFLVLGGSYFVARAVQRELAIVRLQSDFVAAVSHEFRTPLTSMRHLTDLLLTKPAIGDERRRTYYEVMAREIDRLHHFVETLLDFGRMEAGVERYQFEPIDAAPFVSAVVDEFRREIAAGSHPIETNAEEGRAVVRGDREALARALRNLLDNAAKYSPAAAPIHVTLNREGRRVAIGVHDRGPGIPASEQKLIFQKFVRGAASQAAGIKGTGVGLTMVQQIVKDHGGDVRLRSDAAGSSFIILLPDAVEHDT